jgi:acetoacetyl-CoA synthetase
MDGQLLWQPTQQQRDAANLAHYLRWLNAKGWLFENYEALWQWSVQRPEQFWPSLLDYFNVACEGSFSKVTDGRMPDVAWFEGLSLSYAEHVFRQASAERPALLYGSEGTALQAMRWDELETQTAQVQRFLHTCGVRPGDRVAAVLANTPEATVAFLAANACGAVWSCCSPDFGVAAMADRFAQIEPVVLFAVTGYTYNGKTYSRTDEVLKLLAQLPTVRHVVWVGAAPAGTPGAHWSDVTSTSSKPARLSFVRVPFSHPIWILYSSGTTGLPKAITHGTGGILLEQLKYQTFHNDVKPGERFLWYTTTGWMMWNYLLGTMLCGATPVLYDGSPAFPDLGVLWRLVSEFQVQHFGTSAGFLLANNKAQADYRALNWAALRSVSSTGSPLPPEGFEWVYQHVTPDVWLVSMSGGTDVCSAFIGGNPLTPVYAGEIQCRALGCALEAWSEEGKPVTNAVGEMVITQPMPSMPVGFWNDPGGVRYRESYFSHFAEVWRHGDWIKINDRGGIVVYGRSDATLNRGGVRIGTSEVYRAVESVPDVRDSLVVCIERDNGEFYMPLFVVLQPGQTLTETLKNAIVQALRSQYSPRHVPDEIVAAPDIPYTLSGKKTELPVKKILSGKSAAHALQTGSLRNPEALAFFEQLYQSKLKP